MSRLDSLKRLCKIAQSFEEASEHEKIRQTEERAGMSLNDFEDKVGKLIVSKSLTRGGFEFDEIDVGGRLILERLLEGPSIWSDDTFEYPYDFLTTGRTPEDYVSYLEDKKIILR